jgi:hypothetical protein
MAGIIYLLLVGIVWLLLIAIMSPLQLPLTLLGWINPTLRGYRYRFWIWQDRGVNVILGGNPDVTVSSQVGYMALNDKRAAIVMEYFIDFLFYAAIGQKGHCRASIEQDENHERWAKR